MRIAVIVSRFNEAITDGLLVGARQALAEASDALRLVHWRRAGGAQVDSHGSARFESGDVLVVCGLPEHLALLNARVEAL